MSALWLLLGEKAKLCKGCGGLRFCPGERFCRQHRPTSFTQVWSLSLRAKIWHGFPFRGSDAKRNENSHHSMVALWTADSHSQTQSLRNGEQLSKTPLFFFLSNVNDKNNKENTQPRQLVVTAMISNKFGQLLTTEEKTLKRRWSPLDNSGVPSNLVKWSASSKLMHYKNNHNSSDLFTSFSPSKVLLHFRVFCFRGVFFFFLFPHFFNRTLFKCVDLETTSAPFLCTGGRMGSEMPCCTDEQARDNLCIPLFFSFVHNSQLCGGFFFFLNTKQRKKLDSPKSS